jgi:hypothetical protein
MNLLDLMKIAVVLFREQRISRAYMHNFLNYIHEVSLSASDFRNSNYGDQVCPQAIKTLHIAFQDPILCYTQTISLEIAYCLMCT